MRHHRRHYHREESSMGAFLLKFGLLGVLVVVVGGVTWLALTPMDAVQQDVVHVIPNDKFAQ